MITMDYIKTCKEVLLRPSDFFRKMPTMGGYRQPLIFALISFIISFLLNVIISYGMFTFNIHSSILTFGMLVSVFDSLTVSPFIFSPIFYVVGFIFLIFMSIAGIFISALIYNFLYKKLGGTGSYEGTVRFICYSSAIGVLGWIPLINWIVSIYGLYLYIVGGSFVHNVSMKRSAIIIVLSYLAIFVLVVLISVIIGIIVALIVFYSSK